MRKIDRQKEPDFWKEYRKQHPNKRYADLGESSEGNELRQRLRKFLIQSQYGLCAYCCRKIDLGHSLNEHIKPQAIYPKKTMEYENLVASCRDESENTTCGVRKRDEYNEKLFVSPLDEDCEEKFVFYPNGQVDGVGESGEYTCKLLNLNAYALQRARMAQYKVCSSFKDEGLVYSYFLVPNQDGEMAAYSDMIEFFYKRGDFGLAGEG